MVSKFYVQVMILHIEQCILNTKQERPEVAPWIHSNSQRLISARLKTQIGAMTIIQVYAPNMSNTEKEVDEFYRELENAINEAPSQDMMVLMGDFNAKVGKDWGPWDGNLGKFRYGELNARGEILLNFCTAVKN